MKRILNPEIQEFEKKGIQAVRKAGAECMVLLKNEAQILPLNFTGKIALFGNGARQTIKGGTGSGDVNVRHFVTVEEGLENAGVEITTKKWLEQYNTLINDVKKKFSEKICKEVQEAGVDLFLYSMGKIASEPDYEFSLEAEGDTAIYVLARNSGEGMDREIKSGDIELTKTEIRDILALNAKYEKFILVLNVGGVIDLSEVKEVKTILLMSQLGSATGDALADVLFGKSYPSGKLTTTWASIKDYPSTEGFGDLNDTYYNEGVYVGYRYFDTVNLKPSYPFGFGLGYSQFEIENTKVEVSESEIKVEVTVKNIGSFAGKETIQLYVSAPKGKLDKPYQELKGYAKTKELKPNESTVVTILVSLENLSSFYTESLAYVLEAGTYWLRVGFSSRDTKVIAGVVLDKSVEIEKVKAVCTDETLIDVVPKFIGLENDDNGKSEAPIFYLNSNKFTTKIYKYSETQKELNTDKKVFWKSVADKTATLDQFVAQLSNEQLANVCVGAFSTTSGTEIVGNASAKVAGGAGETTHFLKSLGVPSIVMADGPAGLRLAKEYYLIENGEVREKSSDQNLEKFKNNSVYYQYCTAIPIGTALAQSWNDKLVLEIGDIVGSEMELFGVQLWLAPAINIHRSPLCGRNFEYYSEDPFLSGHIGSAIIKGVQKHSGCGTTIKHYACSNQETNRYASNSVVSQRALREIYLKPFEICIKEAQPKTVMSSYNLINKEHSCNTKDIQTHILRDEWGFEGFVMTDWFVTSDMMSNENSKYKCASAAGNVKAGNDLTMPGSKEDLEDLLSAIDNSGHKYPLSRAELQFAAKNILKKVLELLNF